MAETKSTATVKPSTSVQVKKSSNAISYLAPLICIILGYIIWRFLLGNPENFKIKGTGFSGLNMVILKPTLRKYTLVELSFQF
jgi:biopolymer transport protein ExbB